MRVALDCRMADWSGVGRYSTGLVRALAASAEVEIVQVVRPDQAPPVAVAETVEAPGHPFTPAGARALAKVLRVTRPDVTHCLHFPTPLPAPARLVVTMHDLSPLVVPGLMPSAARRLAYRWWNRRAVRVAARILTPSEHTAADIRRLFPSADGRIRVTPLAADDFSSGPVGQLPPGTAEGGYLFSMGNTKPHKDLPTLLRAFARLAPGHPGLELLLAGPDQPGFAASVLGDDPAATRVRFTGAIDDATLRALYAHAAAFAFPSRYEGFGLPVLEAMAMGAPVVVSDAASLPEVAGGAAAIVPGGDADALASALEALLDDPAEREALVAAGRERVAAFSWRETAARTLRAYEEVAAA